MILLMAAATVFAIAVTLSVGDRWGSDIGRQLAILFVMLAVPMWITGLFAGGYV